MIHRTWQGTWLRFMAFIGLAVGLAFALNPPDSGLILDLPETLRPLHYVDWDRLLFGAGVAGWAVITFFGSHRGRAWTAVSACVAIVLGVAAVRLAGPFSPELPTVGVSVLIATVYLPVASLAWRTEAR